MSAEERRRFPRVGHPFLVRYRAATGDMSWRLAPLRNLSADGVCFRGEHTFQVGEEFDLEIILPTVKQPVRAKARIVWSKLVNQPLNLREYGAQWSAMDAEDRALIGETVTSFLRKGKG